MATLVDVPDLTELTQASIIEGRAESRRRPKPLEPWVVIVYDCDCHTFDGVVETFCAVLDMGVDEAWRKASEIHHAGRAIVKHAHQEAAEHYAQAIREHSRGRTVGRRRSEALQVVAAPR